jgi:CubicO group peptidase (beta-lactamase class C family)
MSDTPSLPFCVPGLAVVVARQGDASDRVFVGTDGAGTPLGDDTIFPLASASKLAMGLAVLRAVEQGGVALDDPLDRYLPQAAAARPGVTVRALLCHTSGLPLDLDPAVTALTPTLDWAEIAQGCARTPLAHAPGAQVQYSNVAYGLLAMVLERVAGVDFKTVLETQVFAPMGVEAYIGRIPPRRPAVVVDIDSDHVGTPLEPYNSEFWWRLGTPWAGIYSTADGLLALLQAYVDPRPDVVGAATVAEARRDQTGGLPAGSRPPTRSSASAARARSAGRGAPGGSASSCTATSARTGSPRLRRPTRSARSAPRGASPGATRPGAWRGPRSRRAPPTTAGSCATARRWAAPPCCRAPRSRTVARDAPGHAPGREGPRPLHRQHLPVLDRDRRGRAHGDPSPRRARAPGHRARDVVDHARAAPRRDARG